MFLFNYSLRVIYIFFEFFLEGFVFEVEGKLDIIMIGGGGCREEGDVRGVRWY